MYPKFNSQTTGHNQMHSNVEVSNKERRNY